MTDDLVKRLREKKKALVNGELRSFVEPIKEEAAAEIERLDAALRDRDRMSADIERELNAEIERAEAERDALLIAAEHLLTMCTWKGGKLIDEHCAECISAKSAIDAARGKG